MRIGVLTLSILACASFLTGSSSAAIAEDVKIATVDLQKALLSVEAGKKARSSLEKESQQKMAELKGEQTAIQKLSEEFKKQSLLLSDDARMKKQTELQQRYMKFQEKTVRTQQGMQVRERELTEPLLNKLKTIIGELAKKNNYTVVLEKSQSAVLFSQEKDDLTDEVIKLFNQKHKG